MNAREIEKMTVVKLREECLKIPNIVGVHGMNKEQLINALKEFNNIPIEVRKKPKASVKGLKTKITTMREQLATARTEKNKQRAAYLKKRISSLKKKTRLD
ncbi:transcription termination factor Rho [bacterium]|nr:transcription termination factor Rho [bacterium]